jgi:periplasmic divalent cation tolerance protein
MAKTDEAVFVYSAWPSPDDGRRRRRRPGRGTPGRCGQHHPGMTSIYRWQGAVERAQETLMIIKTRTGRIEEVIAEVRRRHPYDEPGIAVLPLAGGSAGYLDWMRREST